MTSQPQSQSVHCNVITNSAEDPNALTSLPFYHLGNDAFMHYLSYETLPNNRPGVDLLDELLFNPIEFDDDFEGILNDIDPDFNVYRNAQCSLQCEYHNETSFNSYCIRDPVASDTFSILHHNIRSANSNLNDLENFLLSLHHKLSIICLSETWFQDCNVQTFNIPGYSHEYRHRANRHGGGVSIFIKSNIHFTQRVDISLMTPCLEAVFVEISRDSIRDATSNIIVGAIYRPPNTNIDDFIPPMEEILSIIGREKKTCFITGDFNINLLNSNNHLPTQRFIETMYSFSYLPTITKPTRVTDTNATLIDNIFCNEAINNDLSQGIFYVDLTDHFPVFTICKKFGIMPSDNLGINHRNLSAKNTENFKLRLQALNWDDVFSCDNPQAAYNVFHQKFHDTYINSFPLLPKSTKYKSRKPWLTTAVKQSIKIKNKLFVLRRKFPTEENILRYKQYNKVLRSTLRKAEKEHYDSLFDKYKSNLRMSWTIVKDIINKKKTECISDKFLLNGTMTSDKTRIASGFNNFFANVGQTLASRIPHMQDDPTTYINESLLNSMSLESTDEREICNVISGLKCSSPGWDEIQIKIIKAVPNLICAPLAHVFNLSLLSGHVPSQLKRAKVIPLYKKGDKTLLTNHRPISILPALSKILEKLMYNRLVSYFNRHNLLYKFQFGFR